MIISVACLPFHQLECFSKLSLPTTPRPVPVTVCLLWICSFYLPIWSDLSPRESVPGTSSIFIPRFSSVISPPCSFRSREENIVPVIITPLVSDADFMETRLCGAYLYDIPGSRVAHFDAPSPARLGTYECRAPVPPFSSYPKFIRTEGRTHHVTREGSACLHSSAVQSRSLIVFEISPSEISDTPRLSLELQSLRERKYQDNKKPVRLNARRMLIRHVFAPGSSLRLSTQQRSRASTPPRPRITTPPHPLEFAGKKDLPSSKRACFCFRFFFSAQGR